MTDMASTALLSIRGLSKSFGALKATDDVTLDLRPGEIHALIGPNGAGKSTLIGQVAGWIRPDAGRIELMGRDVTRLPVHRRARMGLGRSFQVSSLALPISARRNVMLAVQARLGSSFRFLRPVRTDRRLRDEADAALARVGLSGRADAQAAELSHGERRQLEVACALALKPSILLLDEPMAGLGPEGSAELTRFLADLKREAAILLVEHDMDAVFALADRVTVLVQGRVLMTGTGAEVRADPAVREAYLGEDG